MTYIIVKLFRNKDYNVPWITLFLHMTFINNRMANKCYSAFYFMFLISERTSNAPHIRIRL